MDANNTPYHLLLGARDWRPLINAQADPDLFWDATTASITLTPRVPTLRRDTRVAKSVNARRGAGRDRYGNWYSIGEDEREIRIFPLSGHVSGRFWHVDDLDTQPSLLTEPGTFRPKPVVVPADRPTLSGLAVTRFHYLVVGTLAPSGLLIFDLHGAGPPVWRHWPESVSFAPFDIEPSADGGAWILDRSESRSAGYWRLDSLLRLVPEGGISQLRAARPETFKTLGTGIEQVPAVVFPAPVALSMVSPPDVEDAVAILELPDGSILLLDNPTGETFSVIHRFRDGSAVGTPVSLEAALASISLQPDMGSPDLRGQDFAFLSIDYSATGLIRGALYVAASDSDQSFAFLLTVEGLSLELTPCARYLPMRHFGGKALVAVCGELFYDFGDAWLQLTEHPRRHFAPDAELEGIRFDARLPDTHWHRLLLDGCVPDGTAVEISSRSANDMEGLHTLEWVPEPSPILRASGSELAFGVPAGTDESGRRGTWELLIQNAVGRFIELKLTLSSDGRRSPSINALRAYAPRFSYLKNYLPDVYQQDAQSASFLDRFLSNVEGLWTEIEGEIDHSELLFDTRSAPDEYLDWLAGWLGATLEPSWEKTRRQLFIEHAVELYRWRGTPRGLQALIGLWTDECPDDSLFEILRPDNGTATTVFGGVRIIERFQSRRLPSVALGDSTELSTPLLIGSSDNWLPAHGASALHKLYQDYLRVLYAMSESGDASAVLSEHEALVNLNMSYGTSHRSWTAVMFSPVLPLQEATARDWLTFVDEVMIQPYASITLDDSAHYRGFLTQRYRNTGRLNKTYRLTAENAYKSFDEIELPTRLPQLRKPLDDWIEFASISVPIRRNAHQFTVLMPTRPEESLLRRTEKLDRVADIVNRERPAHTKFDVKPYWALFQVGGARLGIETVVGESSRFVAVILGASYLGESFLAESHPWNIPDRRVVGRPQLTENRI